MRACYCNDSHFLVSVYFTGTRWLSSEHLIWKRFFTSAGVEIIFLWLFHWSPKWSFIVSIDCLHFLFIFLSWRTLFNWGFFLTIFIFLANNFAATLISPYYLQVVYTAYLWQLPRSLQRRDIFVFFVYRYTVCSLIETNCAGSFLQKS